MNFIIKQYKKKLICRYDKDGITPYLSCEDFPNLRCVEKYFTNSRGNTIHYFEYFYDNHHENIVLFCPGLGPGHTAYLREIESLARAGYIVFSLDYTGCDKSSGDSMVSIYEPTRDVDELLNLLSLKDIILFGHSLGGFTALNISRVRKDIKKTICMSGFVSLEALLSDLIKARFVSNSILKYEKKINDIYFGSNFDYVKDTKNSILFIHSKDDQMVKYEKSTLVVEGFNNPNFEFVIVDGKGHNPDYTDESIKCMREVFGEYNRLSKDKKTKDKAIELLKNSSAMKMTNMDKDILDRILEFIK